MGKHHHKRQKKAQASMFPMMMPFPGMGMPQPDSSSSEPESAPSGGAGAPLVAGPAAPAVAPAVPPPPVPATGFSRAQTFVRSLSHKDLSLLVEDMEGKLDSSWTADLSKTGLLGLVYIMSRVKPQSKLSELRCLSAVWALGWHD